MIDPYNAKIIFNLDDFGVGDVFVLSMSDEEPRDIPRICSAGACEANWEKSALDTPAGVLAKLRHEGFRDTHEEMMAYLQFAKIQGFNFLEQMAALVELQMAVEEEDEGDSNA